MKSIINKKLKNLTHKTSNSKKIKSLIEIPSKNIRTFSGVNIYTDEKMVQLVIKKI